MTAAVDELVRPYTPDAPSRPSHLTLVGSDSHRRAVARTPLALRLHRYRFDPSDWMDTLFDLPLTDPAPRNAPCPRVSRPAPSVMRSTSLAAQYTPFTTMPKGVDAGAGQADDMAPMRFLRAYDALGEITSAIRDAVDSLVSTTEKNKTIPRPAWAVPFPGVPQHEHTSHTPCAACAMMDPRRTAPTVMMKGRYPSRVTANPLAGRLLFTVFDMTRDEAWMAGSTPTSLVKYLTNKVENTLEARLSVVLGPNWPEVWAVCTAVASSPTPLVQAAVVHAIREGEPSKKRADTLETVTAEHQKVEAAARKMFSVGKRETVVSALDKFIAVNLPELPDDAGADRPVLAAQWLLSVAWGRHTRGGMPRGSEVHTWMHRYISRLSREGGVPIAGLDLH